MLKPVSGGGLPSEHPYVELKLTFKDGGAFDWHTTFESVRESLAQAQEAAAEGGRQVDWEVVGGEGLPAYEAGPEGSGQAAVRQGEAVTGAGGVGSGRTLQGQRREQAPDEAPPGYEEVQGA